MKRIFCLFISCIFSFASFAQKEYYVYFQADKGQAFYIKTGGKLFNTSSGYLILSQLSDSSYQFNIGFPGSKWPEQIFKIDVQAKDHGFILKNFDDKAWGLIHLSSMTTVMTVNTDKTTTRQGEPNHSAFNQELAKAANDPSLLLKRMPVEKTVVAEQALKPEPVVIAPMAASEAAKQEITITEAKTGALENDTAGTQSLATVSGKDTLASQTLREVIQKDSSSVSKSIPVANLPKKDSVLETEIVNDKPVTPALENNSSIMQVSELPRYNRSKVIRVSESSNADGFALTFLDQVADGTMDTIRILIPQNSEAIITPATEVITEKSGNQKSETVMEKIKCEKRAYILDVIACKRRLFAVENEEQRLTDAKSEIRRFCYTTKQLKEIGEVFPEDATKFRFFEAAVNHVFDRQNFADLSVELKDPEFKERFRSLF